MNDAELEQRLRAEGWPLERIDATTWGSGFQTKSGGEGFRFYIRRTANWIYLTIVPFMAIPENLSEGVELSLLRRLLVLNRDITLAKLALERRDVVLTVELPTENLSWSQVKDGLDALTLYASRHHAELVKLVLP